MDLPQLQFAPVWRAAPQIADALGTALSVAAASMLLAFAIGVAAGLAAANGGTALRRAVSIYVELMRNSPSLVKLYFIFYGLPEFGIFPSPWWAGVLALGIHNGGYMTEIVKGAVGAVTQTQVQAARALGMGWLQIQFVLVIPQAFRIGLPALTNVWVEMIKDTALTSAVAVHELMYLMTSLSSATLRSVELLVVFSTIYFLLTTGFATLLKLLERRSRWMQA